LCLLPERQQSQPTQTQQTEAAGLKENPLKASDFAYEGEYLTCLSTEAVLGIDVSVWQGQIDWEQVKAAGIRFVMIRLGYRSMHEGVVQADSCAAANYAGAKAAGISVGAYFFSQAITVTEAVEEAEFVLETVQDWDVNMPIVYDWEHTGQDTRTANVDARTLTDCAKAFCRRVEAGGYDAMVYFNTYQAENSMYLEELADYPFWLAQYDQMLEYPYRVAMWQYTNQGKVPGITGDVDLNLYFLYR
jgi:GH25 family lysozyme M1 (1,4-beta-N-acetylmuramidase)